MRHVVSTGRRQVPLGLTAALVAVAVLSACGGGGGGGTTSATTPPGSTGTGTGTTSATSTTSPTSPTGTTTASTPATPRTTAQQVRTTAVYFVRAGTLSPAPRSVIAPATATGALRALLAGPNAYERGHGRVTAVPPGTTLRSVAVHSGVATVDLSGRYGDGATGASARQRLAQVVFTATRFAGITSVRFELDGTPVTSFGSGHVGLSRPVGRADFEDVSPAVLTEAPLIGDTIRNPVRVRGTANTFEAVFRLRLTDAAGRTAADVQVKASSGTGTRGTFDVMVPYHATRTGPGTLTSYYVSPANGSNITVQTVPLTLTR